jgi:hypothetical protein
MRKLALFMLTAVMASAACGSSGATQGPATGGGNPTSAAGGNATAAAGGGGDWSSTGSAKVTVGGQEITISPGGCLDGGSVGVDIRFGDWSSHTGDWIVAAVYHDGHEPAAISGKVGGKLFVLDKGMTGSIAGDGTGKFAGTDSIGGNGAISATFSCK